jgi:RNA polymerase sigma-70 factor, ECF subfamily
VSGIEITLPAVAARPGRQTPLAERLGEAEFSRFYAAVAPRLWSYVRAHVPDQAAADDVAQEAFTRFLASNFAPASEEDLVRYLYRTATNLLRDRGRRASRGTLVPLAEADRGESPQPAAAIDLVRALRALPPKDRQLLWLAHAQGFDHREIAEIVGAGAASIRVMLFRARQRLAALLGRGKETEHV